MVATNEVLLGNGNWEVLGRYETIKQAREIAEKLITENGWAVRSIAIPDGWNTVETSTNYDDGSSNEVQSTKSVVDYPLEVRDNAANTLIDALLATCSTKSEKSELAVKILGNDPRE